MTIITERGLYPELAIIEESISKGQTPRKNINYAAYESVLFPISGIYLPLSALAAYYGNERVFDHVLAIPHFDPNVTELCHSSSLLRVLLEKNLNVSSDEKPKYKRMFNALLKNKKLDLSLGNPLYHQTPLHYVAGRGDRDLSIIEKIITTESDFSADLYGANPLFISLQEEQYQTTQHILATADKNIIMQPRIDGNYPLDTACRYSEDLTQGTALVKQLLEKLDPAFYKNSPVLFSVLENQNVICRVAYLKLLLSQGASPNVCNRHGDHLINVVSNKIFQTQDAQIEEQWLQILDILLQHGGNVFFKVKNNQVDFLTVMSREAKGARFVRRILAHFKQDDATLAKILPLIKTGVNEKNDNDDKHDYFEKKIFEINAIPDESAQAIALLKLKNDLASDWDTSLPQNGNAQFRKKVILASLIGFYNRGFLSAESILEVIKIFKGMQGIYISALPYLYREYLVRSLLGFSLSLDKGKSISNALMMATQFLGSFDQQQGEDRLCLLNEFNDIIQRIILLALSEAKHIHGYFATCLIWIEKMPEASFDAQTQILILELKITHAYFQGKLSEFNEYLSKFPSDHILQRQYAYWQVELLFRQTVTVPSVEYIYELNQALEKLQKKYPNIPASYKKEFNDKLTAYRKIAASNKISQKPDKQIPAPPAATTIQIPVSLPVPAANVSNNNNASSSSSASVSEAGLMLNQMKTTTVSDPLSAPVKEKRRHQYIERNAQVMEELVQQVNPHQRPALYTEAQIREKFASVLQPGDELKALTYDNEEGLCWAVCRAHEAVDVTLAQHFQKKFAESYRVKFGHVDSGMCCEKEKNDKKGVIRLKLGHHNERLHGPIYRPAVIPGQPIDRCFLVVLNTRWVHKQAFEQEEIYLDPPNAAKPSKAGFV